MKKINPNLKILEKAFQKSWNSETSYYGDNRLPLSSGQCAVTAMIIQDYFGGELQKIKVGGISHYYNLINNEVIDLTQDQFQIDFDRSSAKSANRKNFNSETIQRYKILKDRIEKIL